MGHRPLDRLILQLTNVPETLYLYFAAVKIGLIPVMTCLRTAKRRLANSRILRMQLRMLYAKRSGTLLPSIVDSSILWSHFN
jgi:acyl-coenzyme A synthetase/AMP-(fatty) acid ligase